MSNLHEFCKGSYHIEGMSIEAKISILDCQTLSRKRVDFIHGLLDDVVLLAGDTYQEWVYAHKLGPVYCHINNLAWISPPPTITYTGI